MIIHLLSTLLVIVEVVVLFNTIIIVHELGHFLAARWRGLFLEEFGVWFGKPLWKKRINGVVYSLGTIPAGGFVKLPQLAPMDIIEGEADLPREKLPSISALDKSIVAVAGPLFSFGFAVLLSFVVYYVGKPTTEMETTTTIGYVMPGSPAEAAGLQPGDIIRKVDGHPVTRFLGMVNSVNWFVVRSEGEKIPFEIERAGKIQTIDSGWVKEEHKGLGRSGLRQVRIAPAETAKIGTVEANTPAAQAELKPGDIITHVNGKAIYTPDALLDVIDKNPAIPVFITVQRGGEWLNFTVQPKLLPSTDGNAPRARIGIGFDFPVIIAHPLPEQQIIDSVNAISNMIGGLISSKSDLKVQHFSGPVGIGRMYYQMLSTEQGWRLALWFSVFFNVNLAILNLLPLPVLDGGHIVLACIEAVRRKPVNIKVLEVIQNTCALMLFGFILYVTFYDVLDLPWRSLRGQSAPTPAQTGK
jgi:regulator of sigma E protease